MSFGFGGFGQNNQSSGFGAGSGFGASTSGGGRFYLFSLPFSFISTFFFLAHPFGSGRYVVRSSRRTRISHDLQIPLGNVEKKLRQPRQLQPTTLVDFSLRLGRAATSRVSSFMTLKSDSHVSLLVF